MTCCAPAVDQDTLAGVNRLPQDDELRLASRNLGNGIIQTDLSVPGIHCAGCITTIEKSLNAMDGVLQARVNLTNKRVSVQWRDGELPPFTQALSRLGYPSHLFDLDADAKDEVLAELLRALGISAFASMNIMLLSVAVWSGAESATRDMFHWISALISLPALYFAGGIYFRSAISALRNRSLNMDVPIAVGITTAFSLSIYDTLHSGQHAYFDGVTTLLFFLLIGRTLDHVMRQRARKAISSLARMSPRGAMVFDENGRRDYRPLSDIQPGMKMLIAAGERIPVDGLVIDGRTDIDCSMATGESAPRFVEPGAPIRAGMLNLTHPITFEATAAAKDSFLFEIMRLMEAAEHGRAGYRLIAERISAAYAPIVHLAAILTLIGWVIVTGDWHRAVTIAVAVLIITCPCALGLAVPMVQVVAARRLFENGIMMKDGSALERLAQIDTAVFDKTGTITLGHPRLTNTHTLDPSALRIATAMAAHSRHPLSRAIYDFGVDFDNAVTGPDEAVHAIAFTSVMEVPGLGMEAVLDGMTYRLGRATWALTGSDANVTHTPSTDIQGTVLACNGSPLAEFTFEDRLRPEAHATIAGLKKRGMSVEIMSGDSEGRVAAVAQAVGVEYYQSGVLPGDKSGHLDALTAQGRKVLMVGDGLNDAPALAAAHVSIAPSSAADIGRNAADFVFLSDALSPILEAHDTSRRAMRLIRQNFGIALIYNFIALPIAFAGYVTPLIAALAMSGSSILVVGNALRLAAAPTRKRPMAEPVENRTHKPA